MSNNFSSNIFLSLLYMYFYKFNVKWLQPLFKTIPFNTFPSMYYIYMPYVSAKSFFLSNGPMHPAFLVTENGYFFYIFLEI